jgi:hypothetical protein
MFKKSPIANATSFIAAFAAHAIGIAAIKDIVGRAAGVRSTYRSINDRQWSVPDRFWRWVRVASAGYLASA